MPSIPVEYDECPAPRNEEDAKKILLNLKEEFSKFGDFSVYAESGEQLTDFSEFLRWLLGDITDPRRQWNLSAGRTETVVSLKGTGSIAGVSVKSGKFTYDFTEAAKALGTYAKRAMPVCANCMHIRSVSLEGTGEVRLQCNKGHGHGYIGDIIAKETMVCGGEDFKYYANDGTDTRGMRLEQTNGRDPRPLPEIIKEIKEIEIFG